MDNTDPTQDPSLPVGVVAGPTTTTGQQSSSTSSTSQATPGPGVTQAIDASTGAGLAGAQAQQDVGTAQADAASKLADNQDEDADLRRQQAADAAANAQDWQDRINRANNDRASAEEALSDHKFHDYFANQSTGKKILEGIGALMTGASGNVAAQQAQNEALQNRVKQDFDQQRAEYTSKLEQARLKGQDVNDIYSQWEHENGNLAVKEAKAHEAIAAKALATATRAGIPVDVAKNNVLVQNATANAQERRVAALQHYDRSNTSNRTSGTETRVTDTKPAKGATPAQLEADAAMADMTPDAQALAKDPLNPDERKVLLSRLNPPKDAHGLVDRTLNKVGQWSLPSLTPEGEKRVQTAQRLVGRLNPAVGEKRTPDSDVAVAVSRLPYTDDPDKSKSDRLLQTIRAQAYKTSNPTAFARAAAPASPKSEPPASVSYDTALAQAKRAMNDPKAPPAAKRAAAAVIDAAAKAK